MTINIALEYRIQEIEWTILHYMSRYLSVVKWEKNCSRSIWIYLCIIK